MQRANPDAINTASASVGAATAVMAGANAGAASTGAASTGAATTGESTSPSPVQTHPANILGKVEYRQGDGPNVTIRPGPVGVQITAIDATLSWADGETRGAAAMPIADFRNYVAKGAIKLTV